MLWPMRLLGMAQLSSNDLRLRTAPFEVREPPISPANDVSAEWWDCLDSETRRCSRWVPRREVAKDWSPDVA